MKFKLLAVMSALSTFAITGNASAEPECVSSYGQTACGYHCKSEYGMVKCAQTPQGVCHAEYGQVKCWDPEVETDEKPQCMAYNGQIDCGYHCKSGYGMVKCAKTPQGVCHAEYEQVKCWDPEVKTDEKPKCMAYNGQIDCGYHCKSDYGTVKCAKTPQGVCHAAYEQVKCWDPEVKTDEKPKCMAYNGQIACGYHCKSDYGTVKCAETPQGICHASDGTVTCWDPEFRTQEDE